MSPERRGEGKEKESQKGRILVVEDKKELRDDIVHYLSLENYTAHGASNVEEGLRLLKKEKYDLVVLDILLEDENGFQVLGEISRKYLEIKTIVLTGMGTVEVAAQASKMGAFATLTKPVSHGDLVVRIREALKPEPPTSDDIEKLREEIREYVRLGRPVEFLMVGKSPAIQEFGRKLGLAARSDAPVLLTGEAGTGKSLAARTIHSLSDFSKGPFEHVLCGGIEPNLIMDELFGHVPGGFSGARADKRGAFERAHLGTIFFDEVGDLPLEGQGAVIFTLDQRKIRRLGSEEEIPVEFREISATNKDLQRGIDEGWFRADLLGRIAVAVIRAPSLRERFDDIPLLVAYFLEKHGKPETKITLEALEKIKAHKEWPDNVRGLENLIKWAVDTSLGKTIEEKHVVFAEWGTKAPEEDRGLEKELWGF